MADFKITRKTTVVAVVIVGVLAVATSLARKAKSVGRKALLELDTIVTPDTLLRWHQRLVAKKRTFTHRRGSGWPGVMRHISELIVRMAEDNPSWGYTRIQGALANLNHRAGCGTIANVLKRNGIEPSPERGRRTRWSTFLKAHWKVLAASEQSVGRRASAEC